MKQLLFIITITLGVVACKPAAKSEGGNKQKDISAVNENASKEALELLHFLYGVSGKYTLSGHHNYPSLMSVYTDSMKVLTGKSPVVWGGDFGFSDERHETDNIIHRKRLVSEIKKYADEGAIITLCYHQANPVEGEPCLFKPGVQYTLSDKQWKDLLTPGTEIYTNWRYQMDSIAVYLKEIEKLKIPVLFRPYHEMNGSWFWWGGRPEEFKKLWVQLYDYYTNVHHINNLLWVWSSDRPWEGVEDYFPGHEYVDILGCDIYPLPDTNVVFRQEWYDRMVKLADGKPFGLTENSVIPSLEEFDRMPDFTWFLSWNELALNDNSLEKLNKIYNSDRVITLDEMPKMREKFKENCKN